MALLIDLVIVVSWILRVTGSSGHSDNDKDRKNKQGNDGGVPTTSPMLKSDREIEREKCVSFLVGYPMSFLVAIPSLFMKEEDDPFFMESG